MHSCKEQFLSTNPMEQFGTTKALKAAALSIWQVLTWAPAEPSQSGVVSAQAQPQRAETRVQGNWFCHAVNPTPRKRFPCQPAQCQDSFYFPDCQSQILSDFRLQKIDYLGSVMTDALLKMSTYSERKGKMSPPAPFLPVSDPSAIHCWAHLCHAWQQQLHQGVCTCIH